MLDINFKASAVKSKRVHSKSKLILV